ncbi:MAG: hypothetical protein RBR52_14600 [Thiomonas sp.]|uniref:hypothetical protein n=1 Tax=Thiomonas sp. TaxID=2047785 RepID=UPI002A371C74|nr:hypothetical protein [Thiomonas sp.]MDY0331705.1 hypothetical protein [Thiomonas sp.]
MTLETLTRSLPVRYFAPFDASGRIDLMLYVRYAHVFLRRNLAVIAAIELLQWPLTGIPCFSDQPLPLWWQIVSNVAVIPFGLMATLSACVLLDGWKNRL